ncbi:hypothetical protein [Natrinema soli]|uniref:Halobacterial output domain-containing protein n=1 Tax=Natrinema soli TaxID=1930624 RepID=A0ABD5SKB1_9EURY|nr:hypothetical protein [Natrinema soli]
MRSIVVSVHTTANGRIEGPNRVADWLDEYAVEPLPDQREFLHSVDTFDRSSVRRMGLVQTRVVEGPGVTHLHYRVDGGQEETEGGES